MALRIIAEIGVDGGRGHAVEYAGAVARAMAIESRLTLCNLAIEMGARSRLRRPRRHHLLLDRGPPVGAAGRAVGTGARLLANPRERCRRAVRPATSPSIAQSLEPQITWGTDPSQTIAVTGRVPDPGRAPSDRRAAMQRALDYMGLTPGTPIAGLPVDRVFIGSCTNARLPDLVAAAAVARGRRVADGVVAMVVPGSSTVKREAEAAGLDRVFRDAGFFWGESGCSMCAGGNGDRGEAGERCVSTTNRNFENRQGPGVRTHLVGPAMAAAAAVAGRIVDVRRLGEDA